MKSISLSGAVLASVLGCVALSVAGAQRNRGLEIGMDAGLFHYSYDISGSSRSTSTTSFSVPVQAARIAFPTDGPFEFEVAGELNHFSTDAADGTDLTAEVALLMELSGGAKETQWFVRPAVGLQHQSGTGGNSSDRATIGAGIGLRMPLTDRIAARFLGRYDYWTKAQNVTANVFGLEAGISVFTR